MPTDWEKMAAFTAPICAAGKDECLYPHRCCEKKFCEMAREYARSQGIELQEGNGRLPFLGENGCTVPPHLRPVCTIHVCTVSWAGKSHIEHDPEKTKEYFALRARLEK